MYYDDPAQDLHIDLPAGTFRLNGAQAESFVRYRQYVSGDIRRTENQRLFLRELLRQKATPALLPELPQLYAVLRDRLRTDLTAEDLLCAAAALRDLSPEQVHLHELPGSPLEVDGVSYYSLDTEAVRTLCAQYFSSETP